MDQNWKRINGANIDEQILCTPGNAVVRYKRREVESITVQSDESGRFANVEILDKSGQITQWTSDRIEVVFCMMWGLPLSFDCKHIFVPQEKGGVSCLSTKDGSLVWKTKSREHFKDILVNGNETLCCASGSHRIVTLDCMSGKELSEMHISNNNQFTVLGKDRVLVDATAKSWYVVNSEALEILETIGKKEINSFHGRDIWRRIYSEWSSEFEDIDSSDVDCN